MQMSYKNLSDKGIIKPFKAASSQIEDQMKLAARDLETAAKILDQDSDWAFNIAYNAILQATRGLIYAEGYRLTSAEGHHKAAIEFAQLALGADFKNEILFFDRMRKKRNQAVYDHAGIISETEARQAIDFATRFVAIIRARIRL
jgi:uncharacterized protein (UPF0332 family)